MLTCKTPWFVIFGLLVVLVYYKRLMGMYRWMGLHFHDWIDYSGVAFSTELLEWGRTFSNFWGERVVHIYG